MDTRIKICCIQSIKEAQTAIKFGADAIGLVGRMPSGPGQIPDSRIREISEAASSETDTFLLTSYTTVEDIIKHHGKTKTNTIQIVDSLTDGTHKQLKESLPDIKIVQVIHVLSEVSIEEANRLSENVDAILLDSGNPGLKVKELGGTGRVHDWNLSRKIKESINCPVYLAGGLNPENVKNAIEAVNPYGIDVCSGVRTNGVLDDDKLMKFIMAVKK